MDIVIEGPDGIEYEIHLLKNKKLADLLFLCTQRHIDIFEGNFPWIKKSLIGYKVHLKKGWRSFKTAIRGGFFIGENAYVHNSLSIEEQLAILFHEMIHILNDDQEGEDVKTEERTTRSAISLINQNKEYLISEGLDPNDIVRFLEYRLEIYKKENV